MKDDVRPAVAKSAQQNKKSPQDTEPVFRTPDEVAALDVARAEPITNLSSRRHRRPHLSWPPSHKTVAFAAVAILIVSGVVAGLVLRQPTATVSSTKPAPKVVPKKIAKPVITSTLSGLPISDNAVNTAPVVGVMIENSLDARPQSGLSEAAIVYEAIAEGGITRFLALFQDTTPANVGPVRSARPYYVQWAMGYQAAYAHVGGSPEALANIRAWGVRDLDQFYNGGSYRRISSRTAPHNVYTSIVDLQNLAKGKGYTTSTYTGFARKKEAAAKQPTAQSINLSLSGTLYNVHYDYDATSNSYKRSEGGAAHVDANTNAQISPKVVVALVIPYGVMADGYHSNYASIGGGTAYVFQDGAVTSATWSKPSNEAALSLTDASGKIMSLNPGQTWITAVADTGRVTYTP